MEALKYKTIIKKDGEIKLTGIPCTKGQEVEMILLIESKSGTVKKEKEMIFDAIELDTSDFLFDREEAHER